MTSSGDGIGTALSDRELVDILRCHFVELLDGVWHPQTVAIAKTIGLTRFHINELWCLTPPTWVCPACARTKPAIARPTRSNELQCVLVEHHDHMPHYLRGRFDQRSREAPQYLASEDSERFVLRSAESLSAFDPIAICQDCNNADATAKRRVKAPNYFSFSGKDIGAFVIAQPNVDHSINDDLLREIWRVQAPRLHTRVALADRIVELAAKGGLWYEVTPAVSRPQDLRRQAERQIGSLLGQASSGVSRFLTVSAVALVREPNVKRWRKRRLSCAPEAPSDMAIRHVSMTHGGHFNVVPSSWICPCCERAKIATIRPSEKFEWSFAVHEERFFDLDNEAVERTVVCIDCQYVRTRLAKEANCDRVLVARSDVVAAIRPQPHSEHRLQPDAIVDTIVERLKIISDKDYRFDF